MMCACEYSRVRHPCACACARLEKTPTHARARARVKPRYHSNTRGTLRPRTSRSCQIAVSKAVRIRESHTRPPTPPHRRRNRYPIGISTRNLTAQCLPSSLIPEASRKPHCCPTQRVGFLPSCSLKPPSRLNRPDRRVFATRASAARITAAASESLRVRDRLEECCAAV